MIRKHKTQYPQHPRHLDLDQTSKDSVQKGVVSTHVPHEEWLRIGEGFRLPAKEQTCKESLECDGQMTSQHKHNANPQRQFGQRWIQSEELLQISTGSNQKARSYSHVLDSKCSLKWSPTSSSAAPEDQESICWNSDSETEGTKKQDSVSPQAKRPRTNYPAKKSRHRVLSSSLRSPGLVQAGGDESEDAISLSASESEEEKQQPASAMQGKVHCPSGSESPVLQIECSGSPSCSLSSTPDRNQDLAIRDPENEPTEDSVSAAGNHPDSPWKDAGPDTGTPSISSCASSQRDSDVSPGQGGLRASEWARQVKWETTPTKQASAAAPHQGDSGKKRRKFTKGGLAEQMSRILQREKSARAIWHHQFKAGVFSGGAGSRGMSLKVGSMKRVHGLWLASCTVVKTPSALQHLSNPQCFVLFPPQSAKHNAVLQQGATVHVYPPWQQVDTAAGKTMLCTRYHVSCCPPSNQSAVKGESSKEDICDVSPSSSPLTFHWRWMCPCSADASLPATRCPAHLFPFMPSSIFQPHLTTQHSELSTPGKALHTVTCGEGELKRTLTFNTLLESIEKAPAGDRLLPLFQATVLRVFCEQQDSGSNSQSLLVEDSQGTVAVISSGATVSRPASLEGRRCSFSCLRVHSRTNADRDPALFSAVCGAWSHRAKAAVASQDDGQAAHTADGQLSSQHLLQPPGFCYLLEVDRGACEVMEGDQWLTMSTTHPFTPPPRLVLTSLARALQNPMQSSRLSVLGKFLYLHEKRSAKGSSDNPGDLSSLETRSLLYVTDHSLQKGHADGRDDVLGTGQDDVVHGDGGRWPAFIPVELREDCATGGLGWASGKFNSRPPVLVLLRDVWLVDGLWIADKYSTVISTDADSTEAAALRVRIDPELYKMVSECSITLPTVSASSHLDSLVSISGTVQGVDEKSAFSWEECDRCGSDQLATRDGSQTLVCLSCRKPVSCPLQKMKMDVTVCTQTDPSVTVSISLQQSTIEQLLPDEEEEEGYDVDCVLNQVVGPLNCIITSTGHCADGNTITAVQLPV